MLSLKEKRSNQRVRQSTALVDPKAVVGLRRKTGQNKQSGRTLPVCLLASPPIMTTRNLDITNGLNESRQSVEPIFRSWSVRTEQPV